MEKIGRSDCFVSPSVLTAQSMCKKYENVNKKNRKIMKKKFNFKAFKHLLVENNLKISDFARLANIPRPTVYSWDNVDEIKNPIAINAIERILHIKYEDLCVPEEELLSPVDLNTRPLEPQRDSGIHDHRREWPVVGTSAAGPQLSAVEISEYPGVADRWEALPEGVKCPDPNGFALVITGDSMTPRLPDGCIVFVAPNVQPQNGQVALVIIEGRAGGRESCVKVIYDEGDTLRLHSYNSDKYPDKIIPKKYIIATYKVVAFKYLVFGEM